MTVEQPRTVFVSGIFNILHPGHVRLLRFASELGDRLVVGVLPDQLASDVVTVGENSRLEAVQSLRMVDDSFIIKDSVTDTIRRLRPAIVVKGREHVTRENEELAVLSTYGGRLLFSSGNSFFSSTDLLRRELDQVPDSPVVLPTDFMKHHEISSSSLVDLLDAMARLRVMVVGDSIVDEYIFCNAVGMSREDPTLVVSPFETKSFIGGAAIVAAHAASFGEKCSLYSVTGSDPQAQFLTKQVEQLGVNCRVITDDSRPTTTKQRWRVGSKTILRVSNLHQDPVSPGLQHAIVRDVEKGLPDHDLLIFSDFNYGTLPQPVVERIVERGQECGIVMAADSQSSSQIGDVSRFVGMQLITPTEHEARVATRNFEDGLVILADELRLKAQAGLVLMTLAEDGVFIRGSSEESSAVFTDQLPALNPTPVDVAGAGDCLLVLAAMALTAGASAHEAALLGSIAAALQVASVGNTPVDVARVRKAISS